MVYDVGNILWKAVGLGFINLADAAQKFSYFLGLRLGSIELDEEGCEEALRWAVENDATYYDSAYVTSSKKVGATLLTADDILYKKAFKETPTVHLKDYQK